MSVSKGLEICGVSAGYEGAPVLEGIELAVEPGSVTCLLGPNGAGKSTVARVVSGLVRPTHGTVDLDGRNITRIPAHRRVELGVALVPEARCLFRELSVRDNLLLGGYTRSPAERAAGLERAVDLFPQLSSLMKQAAGDLSGGEQQMVAIGRGLMSLPKFLVLDEPSLGLAPILTRAILAKTRELATDGVGILLIEQNVVGSLQVADSAVVLEHGHIVVQGTADTVRNDPRVVASYLGATV